MERMFSPEENAVVEDAPDAGQEKQASLDQTLGELHQLQSELAHFITQKIEMQEGPALFSQRGTEVVMDLYRRLGQQIKLIRAEQRGSRRTQNQETR